MGELPREMVILGECDTSRKKDEPLGENTFLVPFFNFFYYFLLVPFKITLDPLTNRYYLKTGCANQVLCRIAHIIVLTMFFYTTVVIVQFLVQKEPAIVIAFELASNISALIAYVIIMNLMWRRQDDFLHVIESTRLPKHRRIRTGKVTIGYLIYACLFFLFACISVVNWFSLNENSNMNMFNYFQIGDGTNSTFQGNSTEVESESRWSWFWEEKTLRVLNGIKFSLIMYTSTFYLTIQGILLVLTLSLKQLGKEFELQIDKYQSTAESSQSIEKGIGCYRKLREICESIRKIYGNHLMAYYVTSVTYYADAPHILLGRRGDTEKVVFIYFLVSAVVWILAAEFHHFVRRTMQKWIRLHSDSKLVSIEDRLKLLAIFGEVSTDPVSLSSKYFRVTYAHIGTMVGVVLTYGIIVCQLYHTDK